MNTADPQTPYHVPVLLRETLDGLAIRDGGIYVDLTFGGGGHSRAILQALQGKGRLYSLDQDDDAAAQAALITAQNFQFVKANFRYVRQFLRLYGVQQVDGIMADLGVSSHQFDTPERGFSIRFEGNLDMRMDTTAPRTAANILNEAREEELHKILGMYGEIRNARTLAQALIRARLRQPLHTIEDLKAVALPLAPRGESNKYLAQVFQALRIAVNEELAALEEMLLQTSELLKPKGRLVILSYHSLEDRPVKNFILKGKFSGELDKDFYGNVHKPFAEVNRKPIIPSADEIANNPRARSAKLRIAERL